MGYYTQYEIESVIGADENNVIDAIRLVSGYSDSFGHEGLKWYNHEKDMREVSLMFNDAIIVISGIGEDAFDIWRKWFCNGKMKHAMAKIEFIEPQEWV